jgi:molybdate transport system regulatory protein
MGMSYRRAWLLVEGLNQALREPLVTTETGGRSGGGASLTPAGERIIDIYRAIEVHARTAASGEFRAMGKLVRSEKSLTCSKRLADHQPREARSFPVQFGRR